MPASLRFSCPILPIDYCTPLAIVNYISRMFEFKAPLAQIKRSTGLSGIVCSNTCAIGVFSLEGQKPISHSQEQVPVCALCQSAGL